MAATIKDGEALSIANAPGVYDWTVFAVGSA